MDSRPSSPGPAIKLLRTTEFLVQRARTGDQDAFARLHALHHESVARSVARRLGCHLRDLLDVEDILQETFLAAWQVIEQDGFRDFRTVGGFRNLLVKIALHKLEDAGRREAAARRMRQRTERLPETELGIAAPGARPSQEARARELEELRERALLELTEAQRWVLDAHENLGMGWAEIAQELGCKPANAKLKYFRAHDKWRELMRKSCGDAEPG